MDLPANQLSEWQPQEERQLQRTHLMHLRQLIDAVSTPVPAYHEQNDAKWIAHKLFVRRFKFCLAWIWPCRIWDRPSMITIRGFNLIPPFPDLSAARMFLQSKTPLYTRHDVPPIFREPYIFTGKNHMLYLKSRATCSKRIIITLLKQIIKGLFTRNVSVITHFALCQWWQCE